MKPKLKHIEYHPLNLSHQQEMFCYHYTTNGYKGMEAAIAAGYSPASARTQSSKLLSKENVKEYIKRHKEVHKVEMTITKDQMINDLLAIRNMCMSKGNMRDALKSMEMINKMCGYNAIEKQEVTITGITWNEEKTYTKILPPSDDTEDDIDENIITIDAPDN